MQEHYLTTFNKILEFEQALAKYTGAPYAVMTDCCTHALELCFRLEGIYYCSFTPYTYLSIPMLMHKLKIKFNYSNESKQEWIGEYHFHDTGIWDSARRLERNMYRPNNMQCLSFGYDKPLQTGRGGAILLDDEHKYKRLLRMRYDGRDLTQVPWAEQRVFEVGYHYRPTIEEAESALVELEKFKLTNTKPKYKSYPDLRTIEIKE